MRGSRAPPANRSSVERDLDQLAVEEERGAVGQAPRLLHQVGDQHDGELRAQLLEHVLDAHGGHRIDRDRELVEQQEVGILRQCARDGEALLLAAREQASERSQAVLHLVPQRGAPQAALDQVVELGLAPSAGEPWRQRHVVVDRQRQPDRKREHHSDPGAQGVDVAPALDRAAVEQQLAFDAHPGRHLVHAVDGAQERGLARAGRADDAEDLVLGDGEVDAVEHALRSIVDREPARLELGHWRGGRRRDGRSRTHHFLRLRT